jgi:O-antigen biosynthesis protein
MKNAIIILTKDNSKLLCQCLDSIKEFTTVDYNIFIGDTGSSKEESDIISKHIGINESIHYLPIGTYNFAKNNNYLASLCTGFDNFIFCNNDIKLLSPVINKFDSLLLDKSIGTVGCKLFFGNDTVQHAGIEIGVMNKNFYITHRGLFSKDCPQISILEPAVGNTAALMGISVEHFKNIGGFPENYIECFEDVELNIKCLEAGLSNIYDGTVSAYHYESQSRNKDSKKNEKMMVDYKERLIPVMQNFLKNPEFLQKYLVRR